MHALTRSFIRSLVRSPLSPSHTIQRRDTSTEAPPLPHPPTHPHRPPTPPPQPQRTGSCRGGACRGTVSAGPPAASACRGRRAPPVCVVATKMQEWTGFRVGWVGWGGGGQGRGGREEGQSQPIYPPHLICTHPTLVHIPPSLPPYLESLRRRARLDHGGARARRAGHHLGLGAPVLLRLCCVCVFFWGGREVGLV